MQRPPFPPAVDNTIRSVMAGCKRKALYRVFLSYQEIEESIHLRAGGAFARGLHVARQAYYGDGIAEEDAIALGWKALIEEYGEEAEGTPNKSAHKMGGALVSYFDEYPMSRDYIRPAQFQDGKPAVEFNFGIPLPILNPETGEPIVYCGRFDMLGQAGEHLYVVDEKTTGSLGQYWATRYELSSQFTGYCWAAQQYGFPVVGAIVRGIGILSREYKHAAMPLMRPQFLIDEWYRQLLKDVREMVRLWRETDWGSLDPNDPASVWAQWEPNLADACGSYGGCQYLPVCSIAPHMREQMLRVNFTIRPWEPLKLLAGDED